MRKIVLLCVLVSACTAALPAGSGVNAQSIMDAVKAKGAPATLHGYTSGSLNHWHAILRQIATGDPRWLAVANEFRAASDASYSQDLEYAVATALTRNASGVLRLKHFDLEGVCDVPFLEPSEKVVHDFQAKATIALATVKDADLLERKAKCQSILMKP